MVDPQCVVTLGNVPLRAVTGERLTVGEAHGRFRTVKNRTVFAMYHPASVIYNPALREIYAADLHILAAWLRKDDI